MNLNMAAASVLQRRKAIFEQRGYSARLVAFHLWTPALSDHVDASIVSTIQGSPVAYVGPDASRSTDHSSGDTPAPPTMVDIATHPLTRGLMSPTSSSALDGRRAPTPKFMCDAVNRHPRFARSNTPSAVSLLADHVPGLSAEQTVQESSRRAMPLTCRRTSPTAPRSL